MTDRLTPPQLQDLADLIERIQFRGLDYAMELRAEAARREAEIKPLPVSMVSADTVEALETMALMKANGPGSAAAPDGTPKQCDGKEQEAFATWAKSQMMDMHEHPLHYLFLDKRTSGARDGWTAALWYCRPFFEALESDKAELVAALREARKSCHPAYAYKIDDLLYKHGGARG